MRDVKQTSGPAHSQMFVHDAGILHGHFPAAKFDEARAQSLVRGEKWCALEHKKSQH